jgi:hypothetical protein
LAQCWFNLVLPGINAAQARKAELAEVDEQVSERRAELARVSSELGRLRAGGFTRDMGLAGQLRDQAGSEFEALELDLARCAVA